MVSNMGTRKVEQAEVGHAVAAQIRRLREQKRLSLHDLSERLKTVGRPILPSGLSKIEQGTRRVDVDDLVALATALGTVPSMLLFQSDGVAPEHVFIENAELVTGAVWAISKCERAGISRHALMEWMNQLDRWRQYPNAADLIAEWAEAAAADE
jgi:transcriptional regulator with XRE-family HTH domain